MVLLRYHIQHFLYLLEVSILNRIVYLSLFYHQRHRSRDTPVGELQPWGGTKWQGYRNIQSYATFKFHCYGHWHNPMSCMPCAIDGNIYKHAANGGTRRYCPSCHKRRLYRLCRFRRYQRNIWGIGERAAFLGHITVKIYCNSSDCISYVLSVSSCWRMEFVLGYGIDFCYRIVCTILVLFCEEVAKQS